MTVGPSSFGRGGGRKVRTRIRAWMGPPLSWAWVVREGHCQGWLLPGFTDNIGGNCKLTTTSVLNFPSSRISWSHTVPDTEDLKMHALQQKDKDCTIPGV